MKKNQTSYPLSGQGGRKTDRQYRRVSTEEQHKEGTSLEWQLAKLAEAAPNAIDYCDAGYTGTNGNRPDMLRLLKDTQPGDKVRVTKLDRLARNLPLLLEIEDKLRYKNVRLISIQRTAHQRNRPT